VTDLTAIESAQRAGITYRQLDHWVTRGYLHPRRRAHNPGSGHPRTFTPREGDVAEAMAGLVALGMLPAAAAKIGRRIVTKGEAKVGGLRITKDAAA
jgi:hypothetical protein